MKVIETSNLSKHFGLGETRVSAVKNVSFEIEEGEFTAIIGPSGSGKTTLLHLIGGLDSPDEGDITLSGEKIAHMKGNQLSDFRRDHIGFIFQAYNLIPVLSAAENIEYIMMLQGIKKPERRRKVEEILETVGLTGLGDRRPAMLSGGQQQRVAVARAMVSKPDIILADEPTANLDSKTGMKLLEVMKELNREFKLTFVFSTHDEKIMNMATRLIHLRDGSIERDEQK
ncbi:MAG: macrolide ABC transporter ATP-binding protein [Gammaproteobacteria bacterium]|nr:macrolide ABC transporter ATP-binding protein [Gammaproteobacteria bacterium]